MPYIHLIDQTSRKKLTYSKSENLSLFDNDVSVYLSATTGNHPALISEHTVNYLSNFTGNNLLNILYNYSTVKTEYLLLYKKDSLKLNLIKPLLKLTKERMKFVFDKIDSHS